MSWPHNKPQTTQSGAGMLKDVYAKDKKIDSQMNDTHAMLSAIKFKLNSNKGTR